MSKRLLLLSLSALLSAGLVTGCGDDDECDLNDVTSCGAGSLCKPEGDDGAAVCVPGCLRDNPATCGASQACEEVEGSDRPLCFTAYELRGKVTNALDAAPISGARVAARDGAGMVGGVTDTNAEGAYAIKVPVKRKADGTPALASGSYTLRADAKDFQTFPGGLRPALPIDVVATAVATGSPAVNLVENAATNIVLFKLPDSARGTIVGRVEGDQRNGALVVSGSSSGIADAFGNFVIFNVPVGEQTVRGYVVGVQLTPKTVQVPENETVRDVVLSPDAAKPLATVVAGVSTISGGAPSYAALAVKQTYIDTLEIGEIPRGLRTALQVPTTEMPGVTIPGVPDGEYVILASLENDGVVRSTSGSGNTELITVTVVDGVASYSGNSFKMTGAVKMTGPAVDGPEEIATNPVFTWVKDSAYSGAATYTLRVFDALGEEVWVKPNIATENSMSEAYAGTTPLKPGMVYQFRVWALDGAGNTLSRTEELRGVFTYTGP